MGHRWCPFEVSLYATTGIRHSVSIAGLPEKGRNVERNTPALEKAFFFQNCRYEYYSLKETDVETSEYKKEKSPWNPGV